MNAHMAFAFYDLPQGSPPAVLDMFLFATKMCNQFNL